VPELGESVAMAALWRAENKCVFCGKNHPESKKDEIKSTGWKRAQIKGVGDHFAADKLRLYPSGQSPPTLYRSEGHHCVAFSSFIKKETIDRIAPLNYYLKDKGYDPNNKNNTIDLPGRKARDDDSPEAQFKEYEKAVIEGKKPMQLHIGGHGSDLMAASHNLVQDVYNLMKHPSMCEDPDQGKWKDKMLQAMKCKEDKAFKRTAMKKSPFICHPRPCRAAEDYVKTKYSISEITYQEL